MSEVYEPEEWTPEEHREAFLLLDSLWDVLYDSGVGDVTADATTKRYSEQIESVSYQTWANRVTNACERTRPAAPAKGA